MLMLMSATLTAYDDGYELETHPGARESDELQQLGDPGRQQGHDEVEGSDPELDPALEVGPELVLLLRPAPRLQDLPARPATRQLNSVHSGIIYRVPQCCY